jgi:Pro-kumamolisin, activation domain/Bacterial Ig-like domain (group 3)
MPRVSTVLRPVFAIVVLLGLHSAASGQAAQAIVHSRVVQVVDDSRRTILSGNTHPLARPEFDQGVLADAEPLRNIVLVLQRSPEQEIALKQLIDQQQDKSSSTYHQWLTPETFGAAFGPTDGDLSAVTSWLSSHGFANIQVNSGRTLIEFTGNAGAVRNAFHASIHRYNVQGEQRFANATDPEIPTALAPIIAGIASLNNFPRKAASYKVGEFRRDPVTHAITRLTNHEPQVDAKTQPQAQAAPSTEPDYTIIDGANTFYGVSPYDFATIYNVLPLWNASTPIDGTGQTIAIVGQTDINPADFVNFRKIFNLPLGNTATPTGTQYLNIIYNGPNPGVTADEGEADIDTQWSGAIAKGATIDYVVSEGTEVTQGTDLSAIYIVNNNLAPVMSYSYGQCELFLGNSGNAFYNTLWQQAAAQGITVMLSSGDSGSAGCDSSGANYASDGLGINGLGSTPYNVSVGGTDFYMPNGGTLYWSATNNSSMQASALGYIPEAPWNQTCTNSAFASSHIFSGETPEQVCNNITAANDGLVTVVGGGGGPSSCTQSNGRSSTSCAGGYPKPSWQTGTGVPSDKVRDVPDVSLFASAGFFGAFYIVCQQSGNPDHQSCSLAAPNYDFAGYGGTSVASPAFAGIVSLVNQKTGSRQGNPNYVLYNLARQQNQSGVPCNSATGAPYAGCVFNDITNGSISMPCIKGSSNCTTNLSSDRYGTLAGWTSTTGYDLATGLGSVNAANLVNNWTNANFKASATSLALSPASITHGSSVVATVNVTSASGTPTGNVSISALAPNGFVQEGVLKAGAYTSSIPNFPGGTYSVRAHYAGDGTYSASDSNTIALTVSPEASATKLQMLLYNFTNGTTSSASTVSYGNFLLLRADVSGLSGQGIATGNIVFTDNGSLLDGGAFRLNSNGYTEDQTSLLSVGTHTITAVYSGDSSFNASQSGASMLTVTKAATSTVMISSPATILASAIFQLVAQVEPQSGGYGLAPTGTVTFSSGSIVIGSSTLSGSQGGGTAITVLASELPVGVDQITLTYSGDANYIGSTSAGTYIVVLASTLTSSSTSITVTPNIVTPSGTVNIGASVGPAVTPIPAGTVQFLVDGQNVGVSQTLSAGQANLASNTSRLSVGTHAVTAVYSGDFHYQASSSAPVTLTVVGASAPTMTTLSVSPASAIQGTIVTVISITTSSTISQASPTGVARLLLDGNFYGQTASLTSGGHATFPLTTNTLQPGAHILQVDYSGDSTYLAGASATATLTILAPVGTFTLSPSTTSATTAQGTPSKAIPLTVTPADGFRSKITFACTGGLPSGAFCLFSPVTITPASSELETTTLTVTPAASSKQIQSRAHPGSWLPLGTSASVAGLLLICIPNRHRRRATLAALLILSTVGVITGCGSGGIEPNPGNSGSVPGSYSITVTATGGSTIQVAIVNLTIQ